MPERYVFDAYHMASASLGNCEVLLTWNFEHILKDRTERLLTVINKSLNIHIPKMRTPEVYVW